MVSGMGRLLDRLGLGRDWVNAESFVIPSRTATGDVMQVSSLPTAVAEAFGINVATDVVTRKEAMTIPAVRQGRNVYAKIGTAPVLCIRERAGKAPERVARRFFEQPDPLRTRASTLTHTVDDLLFHGWSLWKIETRDAQGFPLTAWHVPQWRISVTSEGIRIDGVVVDRDVILFEGPDEGLLRNAGRTLRTTLLLEEAIRVAASAKVPVGLLEDQMGKLTAPEVTELLDSFEKQRAARATGYLPQGLKYVNPNADPEKLQLKDARAFQAAEVARAMNLPAYAVNAPSSDSLTYATTEGNRRDLVDVSFAGFIAAIEGRLSMPDVTPAGTRVVLDLAAFMRGDLSDLIETGAAAVAGKLMTRDEVRTSWLNLPPLGEDTDPDPDPEESA